jgi:hypothetical protein
VSEKSSKANATAGRKVEAPQFNLTAFAHQIASKAVHDYLVKKRNRARNKVAARSRQANRKS